MQLTIENPAGNTATLVRTMTKDEVRGTGGVYRLDPPLGPDAEYVVVTTIPSSVNGGRPTTVIWTGDEDGFAPAIEVNGFPIPGTLTTLVGHESPEAALALFGYNLADAAHDCGGHDIGGEA